MTAAADRAWMLRAIALGAQATRAVRPNPPVGCVLVQGETVVGEGFHAVVGGPHAESVALAQAGDRARGATAYVTLEPCNHWGRTPPCAQALLQAGVARVVVGVRDPHQLAAGGVDNGAPGLRPRYHAGYYAAFVLDPDDPIGDGFVFR